MRRSIESAQRKVRILSLSANAAGTALTGLDELQASLTDTGTGDKLITINEAFSEAPQVQVTCKTADCIAQIGSVTSSTVQVLTFDATDGTTAKDCAVDVLIIGKDVNCKY